MTKEALKLALEALEEAWYHVGTFQPTEKAIDLYDEARTAIKEALALQEYDYKDLYEKEKRKSAMWLAKYEEIAGPAPKAIPMTEPEQEPVEVFLTDEHQMGFKVGVQSFILDYWPDEQAELEFMKTQLLAAFARATPPQRKPLTDEEAQQIFAKHNCTISTHLAGILARAIEAAHGIKENT